MYGKAVNAFRRLSFNFAYIYIGRKFKKSPAEFLEIYFNTSATGYKKRNNRPQILEYMNLSILFNKSYQIITINLTLGQQKALSRCRAVEKLVDQSFSQAHF